MLLILDNLRKCHSLNKQGQKKTTDKFYHIVKLWNSIVTNIKY